MAAKCLLLGVVALCVLAPVGVSAQIVPTWRQEYDKRLKYGDLVEPLKGEIFGEQVNLYDGSISFKATDVSIPGNGGLAVSLSRSYGDVSGSANDKEYGNWDLDIPSLSGTYGDQPETAIGGHWTPSARCSTVSAPPSLDVWNYKHTQTINFSPHTYWEGVRLSLPGGGGETVLAGSGDARQPTPQVGTPTPWNTKGGWFFSCLSALKSGQPGEGFLGHAPDGTKYYFDWMVARENESAVLQPYDTITHATLKRKKDSGAFHLSDIGISSQVRDVDWLGGTAGRPLVGGINIHTHPALDGYNRAYSPFSYWDVETYEKTNSINYVSDPSGVYRLNKDGVSEVVK